MTEPNPTTQEVDPRRRLRELLAVPERERTDAQWDEIIAIEIQTAPGNRMEPTRPPNAPTSTSPARSPARRNTQPAPAPGKKQHRSGRKGPGTGPGAPRPKRDGGIT